MLAAHVCVTFLVIFVSVGHLLLISNVCREIDNKLIAVIYIIHLLLSIFHLN